MSDIALGQPARPGEKIGHYELLSRVEETASIITFRARDPLLERQVVVRQVLAAQGDEGEAMWLRCRRRIDRYRALPVHHRRIAELIEVIEDPRGLFVVFEFLDGPTLETPLSEDQPIAALSTLRVMRSAAMALQPMHQQGLAHHDLRPGNLVLTKAGTVRLTNFGLAVESETMSRAAVRYMAPELCRGETGDAASDLYSLGMIAYEMLLGRPQFEQQFASVLRDPQHEALRWVKWHSNPRSAAPPANKVNPRVPMRLSQLVARMMEKDPIKRPASAQQLLEAIERHFTGDTPPGDSVVNEAMPPSSAPLSPIAISSSTSSGGDTARLPQRSHHKLWITLVAGAVLLAVSGYVVFNSVQQHHKSLAAANANRQLLRQAEQRYLDGKFKQAMSDYQQVADAYAPSQRLGEVARAGVLLCQARLKMEDGQYEQASEDLQRVETMSVFDGETLGDLRQEIEHRRKVSQSFTAIRKDLGDDQLDAADRQIRQMRSMLMSDAERQELDELGAELAGRRTQQRVTQTLAEIDQLVAAGKQDEAIAQLQGSSQRFEPRLQRKLDELLTQRKLDDLVQRAEQAEAAMDWPAAIAVYHEALAIRDSQSLAEKLSQAKMQAALAQGKHLYEQGDRQAAALAFREAQAYGDSDEARGYLAMLKSADDKRTLEQAGDKLAAQAEYAAAASQYAAALALAPSDSALSAKLGDARVQALMIEGRRAMGQGDFDAAKKAFDQAWAIGPGSSVSEALLELEKRSRQAALLSEGDKLRAEGKFGQATRAYRKAKDVLDDAQVQQRLNDVEFEHLLALAHSYMDALRWDAAEAVLQSAQKIYDTPQVQQLMKEAAAGKGAGHE